MESKMRSVKEKLLKPYAQQWDVWVSDETPEHLPKLIKKYANTFLAAGGSNCLDAVLFGISQQEWIIHEGVHPQTFKEKLNRTHQLLNTEEIIKGNVAVWQDPEGKIQHASYHLGD